MLGQNETFYARVFTHHLMVGPRDSVCHPLTQFDLLEKNKIFASTLSRIKIWKEREIKKCIFLTMAERTTNGQRKFVSTSTEVTIVFTHTHTHTKKKPAKDDECFCFLNYYTMEKRDWMCCQKCSIWYHAICVAAKGKRQFIYGK